MMTENKDMITQADLTLLNRFNTEYEVIIELTQENDKYVYSIVIKQDDKKDQLFARNQKKRVFKSFNGLLPFLKENCHKAKSISIKTDIKEFQNLVNIPIHQSDIKHD